MSFLNCAKYPPSLCYLLVTLGPKFLLLAASDCESAWTAPLRTLGRALLFFYLVHLPLAHVAGIMMSLARDGRAEWWFRNPPFEGMPDDYGWSLPVLYVIWISIVIALIPACRAFTQFSRRSV